MPDLIVYSYKLSAGMRLPFITFAIQNGQKWFAVEAYVDRHPCVGPHNRG